MSRHTPGPWEAEDAYVFAGKNCIGICDTDNATQKRLEANAKLMAAAPDLLEALMELHREALLAAGSQPQVAAALKTARAAIAKAGA